MENHNKSLPPRSGRQPDVRTPSWVESPTYLEVAKAKVLLAKICSLKDRGLTAEAGVTDFVFKNIQPLKDKIYPAYLYIEVSDSTRVTSRRIPNEDLLSRLDLMLRGRVSNVGAPLSYSPWNLPPQSPFSNFVSNPHVRDGSPGHRVRPSSEDIEALIAPLRNLPEAEKQTYFEMLSSTDDVEMNVVLNLLARESSDSARTKPMAVAIGQNFGEGEEIQKPEGARRKCSRRVNHPAAPVEEKKKKRRLRRLSCLERDTGPSTLFLGDGLESTILEDNVGGCDDVQVAGGALDEEEEEEEEEIPLIRKNSHRHRVNDIPTQVLLALVSLQGLSISDFDQELEEIILEDLLSEPPEADNPTICSEVPDDGLLPRDPAGQEITRVVSSASSALEGGLPCEDADPSHLAPMDMAEGSSALEVAVMEDPAPEGGAESDPALKGVGAGSLSAASMDVHVGSPPVHSEEAAVTHLSTTLAGLVTLEASDPNAGSLPPADEAEVPLSRAFDIVGNG
jgi:hypothetical protein